MSYEIYERIRNKAGYKDADVSRETGITKSTFSEWRKGTYTPKEDKRKKIAEFLGVSLEYLDTGVVTQKGTIQSFWVPVVGKVQAGIPVDAIEEILDYEQLDPSLEGTGEYFGLKIKGSSMMPRMCEGDVVIVRRQSSVENGDVAVVLVDGIDATIKKVSFGEKSMTLIPFNPSYDPIVYTQEEVKSLPVRIIGKVVELRGKF